MSKTALLLGLVSAALGYALANTYISRLSDHRGYALVAVEDRLGAPRARVPERTLVAVIDGLGYESGLRTGAAERLRTVGACFRTYVGVPSVSRPSYAVISTGLEQDRTGARNNDDESPLAAESIWDVLRQAGRRVEGRSALRWWTELFPAGFDAYLVVPDQDNAFVAPLAADVTLIHPTYVDETAHDHGTLSPLYDRDVHRVDEELSAVLRSLDFGRDLLVLTADHGHRARGGHGGSQSEVTHVLTCFAGRGVKPRKDIGEMDSRALAPALALLLGVRFPKHMRALDDHLEEAFSVASVQPEDEAFFADRRAAMERFRDANRAQLAAWGSSGWRAHEATLARKQGLFGALGALPFIVGISFVLRRGASLRGKLLLAAMPLTAIGASVFVYVLMSGGFDATSINRKAFFVKNALCASVAGVALMNVVFAALLRGRVSRVAGSVLLVLTMLLLSASHLTAYGWPLGYPLPPPWLYFAPFFTSVLLFAAGVELCLVAAVSTFRSRAKRVTGNR